MGNVVTVFTRLRFTFDNRIFYLQTVASTDSRYLYSFVQMEGTKVPVLSVIAFSLKQCCGSGMFIPDPHFSIPAPWSKRSRICIKEFMYF
jgi:hypothetical protein